MTSQPKKISFDKPPLIEVVCGVHFKSMPEFKVPHFGAFWQLLGSDFSSCSENSPLDFQTTPFVEYQLLDSFPLPRIWFTNSDQSEVVQLQRDCFYYDWKATETNTYPRFETVYETFVQKYDLFKNYLKKVNIEKPQELQYELTYINHFPKGREWNDLTDISSALPCFNWNATKHKVLSKPEGLAFSVSFKLDNELGHLRVNLNSAKSRPEEKEILQLTLTAKGMNKSEDSQKMERWFANARHHIVNGFVEVTGSKVQKEVWEKTNE